MSSTTQPSHDEIAAQARTLWEQRGRPADQDTDIWLEAERSLRDRSTASAQTSTKISAPANDPVAQSEKVRRAQNKNVEAKNRAPAPEARNPIPASRSNGPRA